MTFWHGEPIKNEDMQTESLGQYYMAFHNKAKFNGKYDQYGIPLLDYQGAIGLQYNPIAIAQWGLGNYNLWKKNSSDIYKENFLKCSRWMEQNLKDKNGLKLWFHEFDFEYRDTLKKPWYSGLAQGQGLSVLLRAYQITKDEKYLNASKAVFKSLTIEVKEGGVLYVDNNKDTWIEEYIVFPPTHILNGFIWALWGIYDYSIFFRIK